MSLVSKVALEFSARNKASLVMRSFTSSIHGLGRSLFNLRNTIFAVAGIGGFGYMIKQQMQAIDTTAKLSDRLGITTEALVGLQHGAQISGVETATLNKSLEIFSRRLGEVDMGVGQAKYALQELGLNYKDLINLKMDVAFKKVADQINNLSTQSEKAAAANYLFGRSGQSLLNLFDQGSAGIEAFYKEAEKLGLTFDRIDAAKVEAANDALTRTRAVFTGLFRSATIELAPYIEAAANAFIDFATRGEGVGANVTKAMEAVALSIVAVTEQAERAIISLNRLTSPIEFANKSTQATRSAWERYREITGEEMAGRSSLVLSSAPIQPEDMGLFSQILAEERKKLGIEAQEYESKIKEVFNNIRNTAQASAVASVSNESKRAIEQASAQIESSKALLKSAQLQIQEVNKWLDNAAATRVQFYEDMGIYDERYYNMQSRLLDAQVRKYNEYVQDEVLLAEWKALKLEEIEQRISEKEQAELDSRKNAFQKWGDYYTGSNIWDRLAEDTARGFDSMAQAMTNFMVTGESDWQAWTQSLLTAYLDTINKMIIASTLVPWTEALVGGFAGLFTGGAAKTTLPKAGTVTPEYGAVVSRYHGGGIVGLDRSLVEIVPASMLANAPELHTGTNEYYAKLKRKEGVFTEEQMSHLAPAGQLKNIAPAINIYNESGQKLETQGEPEFDGEKWVVNIVAKNYAQGGTLRKLMKK